MNSEQIWAIATKPLGLLLARVLLDVLLQGKVFISCPNNPDSVSCRFLMGVIILCFFYSYTLVLALDSTTENKANT